VDLDAEVTAVEAASVLGVDRHVIYMWRALGKVDPVGSRGRSPLYRWGDLLGVERETRANDPAGQRSLRAG
jgi:hypothetical protein